MGDRKGLMDDILKRTVRQALETEQAFGLHELPKVTGMGPLPVASSADASAAGKRERLERLNAEFAQCRQCGLCETRTHVVFGSGDPEAQLMFVGEAPGFDEDKQGLPFVGAAGQLLTKIIEAMKFRREEVYIANCLKCRPPQNRDPQPFEIETCKPILMRQIEVIRPRVICALGKFAAQTLLETQTPISRLRGRFFDWNGTKLLATFHPAYLLRNPADKKLAWQDVQQIMRYLGKL